MERLNRHELVAGSEGERSEGQHHGGHRMGQRPGKPVATGVGMEKAQ